MDKDLILKYLWSLVGVPYVWGGKGPDGFDCSGLVVEILKARGFVDHKYDASAHDLFLTTKDGGMLKPRAHALAFYGTKYRVTHVGICVSDTHMIEAGGGNSSCIDLESASKLGAFVRLRPVFSRKDFVAIHDIDATMFKI